MANGYDDRFCGCNNGCGGFSGNSFLIFLLFILLFSCGGGLNNGCSNCGCNNCGCNNNCGCLER